MRESPLSLTLKGITGTFLEDFIEVRQPNLTRRYELLPFSLCETCSSPLTGKEEEPGSCWSCTRYGDLSGFNNCFAMSPYNKARRTDVVRDVREKLSGHMNGSLRLGVALAVFVQGFATEVREGNVIVPVPMHPVDLQKRGFNHAEVIAGQAGSLLEIPVESETLLKVRQGAQRDASSRAERKANVEGMYNFRPFDNPPKTAILIDDMMTTGLTANECSYQLHDAGAENVYVLVAARNVFPGDAT